MHSPPGAFPVGKTDAEAVRGSERRDPPHGRGGQSHFRAHSPRPFAIAGGSKREQRPQAGDELVGIGERVGVERHDGRLLVHDPHQAKECDCQNS